MDKIVKQTKLLAISLILISIIGLSGCTGNYISIPTNTNKDTILTTYAKIANANYIDTLADAKALEKAVKIFTSHPTKETFANAKVAWINSRESYGQTEIFRLSNGPIDGEEGWVTKKYGALEGQINAWPLDENMIDYTIDANGKRTSGNIIDSIDKFNPGGVGSTAVDISTINIDAITALNENGGDANVATGYHAVEFLLWGQDQDYSNFIKDSITKGALVAGQRPLSDYTTDKYKHRRKAFLNAATSKIVLDLEVVSSGWEKGADYRRAFLNKHSDSKKNISPQKAMRTIFTSMGVFIKSELANERIAVAVLTPSEEDEHSCFSDNTHRDIATNYQGFKNILMGTYKGRDFGTAPIDAMSGDAKVKILSLMKKIEIKITSINIIAKTSRHFDRQIQEDDPQSRVIIKLKNELRKLGDQMVNVASANGINLIEEDIVDAKETKL